MFWQTTRFRIDLRRPVVMGIVNVTPDSFSDGGRHGDAAAALAHCERLVAEGRTNRQVGAELFISETTVKTHVNHGGDIVQRFWQPLGQSDFGGIIAQLPDNVDAIYLGLGGTDAINFLNQYQQAGTDINLIGGSIMFGARRVQGGRGAGISRRSGLRCAVAGSR